jgi:hypothetical protein
MYGLQALYAFYRYWSRYKTHYMNSYSAWIRSDYQRQEQAHYCEEDQFLYHICDTSNLID